MAKKRAPKLSQIPNPSEGGMPERIPVGQLLLDADNPRLASGVNSQAQEDILRVLWNEMAVDEVAISIAENGYFPEEPLLVIPKETMESDETKRRYIVVEGNRRLGAVLLLRNEKLRHKIKATDLPTITVERHKSLDRIPVSI